MPDTIPTTHLELYAGQLHLFGELALSRENAVKLIRSAYRGASYEAALRQIARGGRLNADLSSWAQTALDEVAPAEPVWRGDDVVRVSVRSNAQPQPV